MDGMIGISDKLDQSTPFEPVSYYDLTIRSGGDGPTSRLIISHPDACRLVVHEDRIGLHCEEGSTRFYIVIGNR